MLFFSYSVVIGYFGSVILTEEIPYHAVLYISRTEQAFVFEAILCYNIFSKKLKQKQNAK